MNEIAKRILNAAERLRPDQQQVLLDIAESLAKPSRFFESMSERERAELDRAIDEADRGETVTQAELDRRLDVLRHGSR